MVCERLQKEVVSNLCSEMLLGFQKEGNMDQYKQSHEGGEVQGIFKELR